MTVQECYEKLHGNYDDAKRRLMSDKIIEKFIIKFLADDSMSKLLNVTNACDIEGAFMSAHTLKGVAANLGFTELQQNASNLTEQLRDRSSQPDKDLLSEVEKSYKLVIDTIEEYKSQL